MNKVIKNILKYTAFFALGAVIFWWVYRGQDIDKIKASLQQADFLWLIIAGFVLSPLSHVSRAMRWNILLKPMGYTPRTINSFAAVMIMYLSNTALPRSGELIRCATMTKYEKIPFAKSLGTLISERLIDMLMLLIFLAIVLVTQMPKVAEMLNNNPEIKENLKSIVSSMPFLISLGILGLVLTYIAYRYRHKISHLGFYSKLSDLVKKFKDGIISILKMERRGAFVLHSVAIWVLYFLMIYIPFWSFDFTSHLGMLAGLTIFVMSAFGMVAPSPGGIGTWHFMVIASLWVYGVTDAQAGAFAFAVHSIITLSNLIFGAVMLILLPAINSKSNDYAKIV